MHLNEAWFVSHVRAHALWIPLERFVNINKLYETNMKWKRTVRGLSWWTVDAILMYVMKGGFVLTFTNG